MINNTVRAFAMGLIVLCLSGCIYSDVRVPMSKEFRNTQIVSKSGKSTARSVAWLVAWGDAGLQSAAEDGGLTTLEYADSAFLNIIFGLYLSRTTIVYGN